MGKHFSKGKLCQLELNAGPKRGDSQSWREPSHTHPSHHILASIRARGQKGTAVDPGQGHVPAHLHIPMPHPGLPAPNDRPIIHATFFSFSSLWRPSLPFWKIRIKQNALQTPRCGGFFWAQEERLHCSPITMSWGYQGQWGPTHPAQRDPSSWTPKTCLCKPTFPWPLHGTATTLYPVDGWDPSGHCYLLHIYPMLPALFTGQLALFLQIHSLKAGMDSFIPTILCGTMSNARSTLTLELWGERRRHSLRLIGFLKWETTEVISEQHHNPWL